MEDNNNLKKSANCGFVTIPQNIPCSNGNNQKKYFSQKQSLYEGVKEYLHNKYKNA